jgi:hypothetical protein
MVALGGVGETIAGTYDVAPPMFDAQPHTLLAYVDNMFSQPPTTRDWDTGAFF